MTQSERIAEQLIAVNEPRPPRGAFRGEFHDAYGFVANIYVVDGRAMIAEPREGGRGEIAKRLPGTFALDRFEQCGGYHVSAAQYVKKWRFKA